MSDGSNLSPEARRMVRRTELFWLALLMIGVIRAGIAFQTYLTAAP